MSFELPPDIIEELKTVSEIDIEEILRNPESAFTHEPLNDQRQYEAVKFHDSVISNPDLFIGSGNDGVVFDLPSTKGEPVFCLKNIWEQVSVEMQNKQFYRLPTKLQALRKIQMYFAEVKEKKREGVKKGINYAISNSPIAEAGFQIAARAILQDAGFNNAVPDIKSIIRIETKIEGDVDGALYSCNELADVIIMDKVDGKSIQDFILNYEQYPKVFEQLDPLIFKEKLRTLIQALHDRGLTHQDITRRNIMINFETNDPVIIDFGKASFGLGNFTPEQEMSAVDEVCRTLLNFKQKPEETRQAMKKRLKIAF